MRHTDAEQVYALMSVSLDEYFVPDIPAYFLAQWPRGSFVAVDFAGNLVGYIAGSMLSGGRASVALLCVSPYARNRGIGGALLTRVMNAARLEGVRTVQLEVRSDNTSAIRFYVRYGFTAVENLPSFYNDGGSAVRMTASAFGLNN